MMGAKVQSILILIIFLKMICENSVISEEHATSGGYGNDNEIVLKIFPGSITDRELKTVHSRKARSVNSQPSQTWYVLKLLKQLRKVEDVLTVEEEEPTTEPAATTQRETTLQQITEVPTTETTLKEALTTTEIFTTIEESTTEDLKVEPDSTTEIFTPTEERQPVESTTLEIFPTDKTTMVEILPTTGASVGQEIPEQTTHYKPTTEDARAETIFITTGGLAGHTLPQETVAVEYTTQDLKVETKPTTEIFTTSELPQETITAEHTTQDLKVGTKSTTQIFTTQDPLGHKLPQATATVEYTTEEIEVGTNTAETLTTAKVLSTTEETTTVESTSQNLITTAVFVETEQTTAVTPRTEEITQNKNTVETTPLKSQTEVITHSENPTTESSTETEVSTKRNDETTDISAIRTPEDSSEDIGLITRETYSTTTQFVTTDDSGNPTLTTSLLENQETETVPTSTENTNEQFTIDASVDPDATGNEDIINLVVSILQYLGHISGEMLEAIQAKNFPKIHQFISENSWLIPPEPRRRRNLPESPCSSYDLYCPHEGNFRLNQSCTLYYQCKFSPTCNKTIPNLRKCPKCFKFNAQKSHCDLPENVPECTYSSAQRFTCTGPGNYFVPDDCHKYYECRKNGNGTVIDLAVKTCPSGMVFRPIEGKCVHGKCKLRTAKCAPEAFYSVDRFSCSRFHYCVGGNQTISMLCPTGFVFEGQLCDRWGQSELKRRLLRIQRT